MKVYKFGGASIRDAESIKNVCNIIRQAGEAPLMVVVSAAGKTTNALEKVAEAYFLNTGEAKGLLQQVRERHFDIAADLFAADHRVFDELANIFVELEWQLEEDRMESYNYVYDQVVSAGEFLSTTLVSHYLRQSGISNHWLDVRDVLKTDDHYREARVDWEATQRLISEKALPIVRQQVVITQGFIGCTAENCTTTLGREGSDFTAAVFANVLDAEAQYVWKDVPGILSGDPRVWEQTELIGEMTYHEAIEMTYYGAQVIHPKTIKPLQNKQIPLMVRSFKDPHAGGTKIFRAEPEPEYPPIRVLKRHQALINLYSRDYSFIEEQAMSRLATAFSEADLRINMMQHAAIQFQAVTEHLPDRIEELSRKLDADFRIQVETGLTLLTVRHYTGEAIQKAMGDASAILEQKRPTTYQALLMGTH